MSDDESPAAGQSRFEFVTRRALLRAGVGTGLTAGLFGLSACGRSDAEVFAGRTTVARPTTAAATTTRSAAATTSAASPAAAGPATPTTPAAGGPTSQPKGATPPVKASLPTAVVSDPLPSSAHLAVKFTFAVGSSGFAVPNPFVASWIESDSGQMLKTIGLWVSGGKNSRYLPELQRWYQQELARQGSGGPTTAETVTGATRAPGEFSMNWDCTDFFGTQQGVANYWICIEAAREHGPYELIRQSLAIGTSSFTKDLPPQGELTRATVTYGV